MKNQLILCIMLVVATSQSYSQVIKIDDFELNDFDMFPAGWEVRGEEAKKEYLVNQDAKGNRYLAAQSLDSDMFILKKIKVDLVEYPYLNWKWRAKEFPMNGDESVKNFCDAAASISVVLKLSKWRPKSIKYTWSTSLERGKVTESPYSVWPSRTDIIVLQSGKTETDGWQTEKRNVLADYLSLYGEKMVKSLIIEAIAIMTDSDNTKTLSAADYDNMFFSKN